MKVVEELAAELQIELVAEPADPLVYAFRLQFKIFFVVETDFIWGHDALPPFFISPA
jgi:hypothetical protein